MINDKLWIYVGTYTHQNGKGIYRCDLDLATGKLSFGKWDDNNRSDEDSSRQGLVAETPQPSFLAIHPERPLLYCVNEIRDYSNSQSGSISAYEIQSKTGQLQFLNCMASQGPAPCHLAVDPTGRCVMAANYAGGSVVCYPILPDGRLAEATSFIQHEGSSIHSVRQSAPHAHCITPDPAGRFAFVADLGLDKVMVYRIDTVNQGLIPNSPPSVDLAAGAGPRHIVFSKDSRFAYVINELSSTLSAFEYNGEHGTLSSLLDISTLPDNFRNESDAGEIAIHPSGRFLYCSNRGHDSIAIFALDPQSGIPTACGHQSTLGRWPRHFCITPSGEYMLVANQLSDTISVFRVNSESGDLIPVTSSFKVPNPVCLLPTRIY